MNRVEELGQLRQAAADAEGARAASVILVTGMSGVGKTQLVSRWVNEELRERFPDGQLYIDLADVRSGGAVDVSDVLGRFLNALGTPYDVMPAGLGARTGHFLSVAAGLDLLVVVDNAQHAPEVGPLVPPSGLLVVTSRTRMPTLEYDGAVQVVVEPLKPDAGVELVRSWEVHASDGSAGELVRRCGGLPLALRQAGEWLVKRPHLSLDAAVRRLAPREAAADGSGQRRESSGGGTHAHDLLSRMDVTGTVTAVFDAVLDQLPPHTLRLYRILGCMPGTTFTTALVEAAGAEQVDDALADLFTSHLVSKAPTAARPARFRMHDLVRAHARRLAEQLPEDEVRSVRRAVTGFYTDAATHADRMASPGRFRLQGAPARSLDELSPDEPLFTTEAEALEWLDAERANMLDVMDWAEQEQWHAPAWQLCESLWQLYNGRKHHTDWIEAHTLGVRAAERDGAPGAEIRMRNQLARAYYELGDHDQATRQLDRAAVLLDQVEDPRLHGVVWETQGLVALARRQPQDALALFGRALRANNARGDQHGVLVQSYNLGQAWLAAGEWHQALDVVDAAMATAEETRDSMRPRIALVQARAYQGLDQLDQAVRAANSAVEHATSLGLTTKSFEALELLSQLADEVGDERLRAGCQRQLGELRQRVGLAGPGTGEARQRGRRCPG